MAVLTSPVPATLTIAGRKSQTFELQSLPHRLPRGTSPSVAELSTRLYAAYEVAGGNVRLAGCALELRPIVHVRGRTQSAGFEREESGDLFLGDDGLPLEASVRSQLRDDDFVAGDRPTRFPAAMLNRLIDRARWLLGEKCREMGVELDEDSIDTEVFWRRFAEGKLRFNIGEKFVDVPFADWADRLQPPPFSCPETGAKTFKVAATDDGRIIAAEELVTCEQTARRMLRSETVVCSSTGRRIAAELAEQCPITSEHVSREQMTTCSICGISVAESALEGHQCRACAAKVAVRKTDPRMCLVLGEHLGLERWRRWRLAETPQAYVLEARSLLQRLLVVVDKQTLEVKRLARRSRFQSAWNDIEPQGWREFLQ